MKIRLPLPKDAEFFNKYAALVFALKRYGVVAQSIAALTELGILYALIYGTLSDITPSFGPVISIAGALVAASMLQVGLRFSLPYVVRSVLYKRFRNLDLAFTVVVWVLLLALLTVSITLSWLGSKSIAETFTPKPIERTTLLTDGEKKAANETAEKLFLTDSLTIAAKFSGKIEATKAALQTQIDATDGKASNASIKSPQWSRELKAKAQTLRGEMTAKLATLESERATEIQTAAKDRANALGEASTRRNREADKIQSDNEAAQTKTTFKTNRYGGYLGIFTLVCYLFFIVSTILNEMLNKGAKIEALPMPTQYDFLPSVFAEWKTAISDRLNQIFRQHIQTFSDNTKAAPMPEKMPMLYDYKAQPLETVLTVVSEPPKETAIIKLPVKMPKIAATVKSDDKTVTPRPIGFHTDKTIVSDPTTDKIINDKPYTKIVTIQKGSHLRTCEQCKTSYVYNHHKQKYCGETCRVEAWEKRTGRIFNKGK